MANNHETLASLFTATADAIREKTGGTEPIVADLFPEAIKEIETGSKTYGNGVGQISSFELYLEGHNMSTYKRGG